MEKALRKIIKAVYWFEKGKEEDDVDCLFGLGMCYYNGFGVYQNKTIALKLINQAKDRGQKSAIEFLKDLEK